MILLKEDPFKIGYHIGNNIIDLEPNIDIDYTDLETFPPSGFVGDIVDVIRMFKIIS